ncbi:MAG: hypothetical protein ABWZ25_03780 [Chitinophagaceae bacterium]
MKIIILLTSIMMLAQSLTAQTSARKRPGLKTRLYPRVTELHLNNPLYKTIPKKGKFAGISDDRILYQASSRGRKLDGIWISWYEGRITCDSGRFVKGLPDGEWKRWSPDGKLVSVRTYSAVKYERITYEMAHANPKAILYPVSRIYRRDPAVALHYLHADYSFPGQPAIRQESLEDHVLQNTSGEDTYHPVFHRSLHHGLYLNLDEHGLAIDSGFYRNGLREGLWIHRQPDGQREEGSYSHGKRDKEWKQYNIKGKLIQLTIYDSRGREEWSKNFN